MRALSNPSVPCEALTKIYKTQTTKVSKGESDSTEATSHQKKNNIYNLTSQSDYLTRGDVSRTNGRVLPGVAEVALASGLQKKYYHLMITILSVLNEYEN